MVNHGTAWTVGWLEVMLFVTVILAPAQSLPVCPNTGSSCQCDDWIEVMQPGNGCRIGNHGGGECNPLPPLCLLPFLVLVIPYYCTL